MSTSMWDRVVGQERAVALLQQAAARPVHAYLLVGPRGSGVETAARCFAAAIATPEDDERGRDLVLRGLHPDVLEIDPPATQIRVEDAQSVVLEVSRSPVEGLRRVVLVFDAERLNDTAANKLLKTLEEPPAGACIVLLTAGADRLLPTIRSRCQPVEFASLSSGAVRDALLADGADGETAGLMANLAGGRIDRARALAGRLGVVRDAFVTAAARADGTGAAASSSAADAQAAVQEAIAGIEADQERAVAETEAELTAAGYPERTVRARLRRLDEQHRRIARHARVDALLEGIVALESVYRDALAGPEAAALNADRPRVEVPPREAVRVLGLCRSARQVLVEHNPNEGLLLERLFVHLPASSGGRRR